MVLVPSYIDIDGLVVPLRVDPPIGDWPVQVLIRGDLEDKKLDGLMYAVGGLVNRPAQEVISLIQDRQDLPMRQELAAGPVPAEYAEDFSREARNWASLTGSWPDMSDVYSVGASFLSDNIVIPRLTFIKLMEKLYELNAEVQQGKREPRIDDSIPLPPPRIPLPERMPPWLDHEMQVLEAEAARLDEDDPLSPDLTDPSRAESIADDRGFVIAMLEIVYKYVRAGAPDLPARFERLGLSALVSYQRSLPKLEAYLQDPRRIAIVEDAITTAKKQAGVTGPVTVAEDIAARGLDVTPFTADVSIDLFRLPEPLRPSGISAHEWLASCEAVFLHVRITGITSSVALTGAGDLFTRVQGHSVRLRYRPEITPVPRLWRVELT